MAHYDYRKVFFRRPFWTELNVLFYRILIVVAVGIFLVVVLSIRYFDRLPPHVIHSKVKKTYINYIVNIYQNLPAPEEEPVTETLDVDLLPLTPAPEREDRLVEPPARSVIEEAVAAVEETMTEGMGATPAEPVDPSIVALLKSTGTSQEIIRSAIESSPGLILPEETPVYTPIATYRQRAEEYEKGVERYSRVTMEKIQVPPPEFTDFEVVKGVRDYEQTLMVANGNKYLIKYCIDKYYRHDPSVRGNIVVKFDIHPEGYVIPESIRIVRSDIQDPRVLRCIKRTIRRWRNFPRVAYEMGEYTITQKYIF
ncbi:MAG: AgmX/PglI C-terminal domain-containing protein [Calditrichaeota bacterium]|nr:AgmX/PglI C-terminal domain-containing protein [Calditrichota bacterium]